MIRSVTIAKCDDYTQDWWMLGIQKYGKGKNEVIVKKTPADCISHAAPRQMQRCKWRVLYKHGTL